MTYSGEAETNVGSGFVKNVVRVINNCKEKILDVTLRHVKIDGTEKGKAAVSVEGSGSTTIKLEGDNELLATMSTPPSKRTMTEMQVSRVHSPSLPTVRLLAS